MTPLETSDSILGRDPKIKDHFYQPLHFNHVETETREQWDFPKVT